LERILTDDTLMTDQAMCQTNAFVLTTVKIFFMETQILTVDTLLTD